jgi:hypothetical protein
MKMRRTLAGFYVRFRGDELNVRSEAQIVTAPFGKWSRSWSDLSRFGKFEGVFYIDSQIADRVLDLGMAQ